MLRELKPNCMRCSMEDFQHLGVKVMWFFSVIMLISGIAGNDWQVASYLVKIPTYMGFTERPVKAKYGLWNIIFDGPGTDDHTVASVEAWSKAQPHLDGSIARIFFIRIALIIALIFSAFYFVSYMKSRMNPYAEAKVTRKYLSFGSLSVLTSFVLTLVSIIVFATIPQTAFHVFCDGLGCRREDPSTIDENKFGSLFGVIIAKICLDFVIFVLNETIARHEKPADADSTKSPPPVVEMA